MNFHKAQSLACCLRIFWVNKTRVNSLPFNHKRHFNYEFNVKLNHRLTKSKKNHSN